MDHSMEIPSSCSPQQDESATCFPGLDDSDNDSLNLADNDGFHNMLKGYQVFNNDIPSSSRPLASVITVPVHNDSVTISSGQIRSAAVGATGNSEQIHIFTSSGPSSGQPGGVGEGGDDRPPSNGLSVEIVDGEVDIQESHQEVVGGNSSSSNVYYSDSHNHTTLVCADDGHYVISTPQDGQIPGDESLLEHVVSEGSEGPYPRDQIDETDVRMSQTASFGTQTGVGGDDTLQFAQLPSPQVLVRESDSDKSSLVTTVTSSELSSIDGVKDETSDIIPPTDFETLPYDWQPFTSHKSREELELSQTQTQTQTVLDKVTPESGMNHRNYPGRYSTPIVPPRRQLSLVSVEMANTTPILPVSGSDDSSVTPPVTSSDIMNRRTSVIEQILRYVHMLPLEVLEVHLSGLQQASEAQPIGVVGDKPVSSGSLFSSQSHSTSVKSGELADVSESPSDKTCLSSQSLDNLISRSHRYSSQGHTPNNVMTLSSTTTSSDDFAKPHPRTPRVRKRRSAPPGTVVVTTDTTIDSTPVLSEGGAESTRLQSIPAVCNASQFQPPATSSQSLTSFTSPQITDTSLVTEKPPEITDTSLVTEKPPEITDTSLVTEKPPQITDTSLVTEKPPISPGCKTFEPPCKRTRAAVSASEMHPIEPLTPTDIMKPSLPSQVDSTTQTEERVPPENTVSVATAVRKRGRPITRKRGPLSPAPQSKCTIPANIDEQHSSLDDFKIEPNKKGKQSAVTTSNSTAKKGGKTDPGPVTGAVGNCEPANMKSTVSEYTPGPSSYSVIGYSTPSTGQSVLGYHKPLSSCSFNSPFATLPINAAPSIRTETPTVEVEGEEVETTVIARWNDGYFYPGKVYATKTDYLGRLYVHFDDGDQCYINETFVIILSVLPIGQSVLAQTEEQKYVQGIITSHITVEDEPGYEVQFGPEYTARFCASQVILTKEQAEELGTQCKRNPPTTGLTNVTLDNIMTGKRNRNQSPSWESPTNSPKKRLMKKPTPFTSSSVMRGKDQIKGKIQGLSGPQEKSAEPMSPSTSTVTDIQNDLTVSSPVIGSHIPKPPSNDPSTKKAASSTINRPTQSPRRQKKKEPGRCSIFAGRLFILTGPVDIKRRMALKSDEASSDNATSTEEVELPVFNKETVTKQVISGGGTVLQSFDIRRVSQSVQENKCFLICNTYARTKKYFQCLSMAVPCVNHLWVRDCCNQNVFLDYRNYLLPAGDSLLSKRLKEWHGRSAMLHGLRVLVASNDDTFNETWNDVLSAAGCEIATRTSLRARSPDAICGMVIISDLTCSQAVKETAMGSNIPIVSQEWLIQCLINGERLAYDSSTEFPIV